MGSKFDAAFALYVKGRSLNEQDFGAGNVHGLTFKFTSHILQGLAERLRPGWENAAGKFRQK